MANSEYFATKRGMRKVMHDGMERFVWPCFVLGCRNMSDLDVDPSLLCSGHLAMVPPAMIVAMDDTKSVDDFSRARQAVLKYATEVDDVING